MEFANAVKKVFPDGNGQSILVHTCCAVCLCYPSQFLKMLNYKPVIYFYNPNIHPQEEHKRRLDELEEYCKKYSFELVKESYKPEEFYKAASGYECEPEKGARCEKCFALRLNKTAKKAKELGINKFTTTLTVSPHKNSQVVFEQGEIAGKNFGIEFAQFDFKKNNGSKVTQEIAKFNNMYKQNYCGCEFSIR